MKIFILIIITLTLFSENIQADPCGEVIFNKYGMLKKYEYLNLSISENTKKHGLSSTVGSSTENSTAIFDPGVSTGVYVSWSQSSSTYGGCKWLGLAYLAKKRTEFIAQNLDVLINEMAMGQGKMLDTLVKSYFCPMSQEGFVKVNIQKNFESLSLGNSNPKSINDKILTVLPSSCLQVV